jgi:transposase-like protein
MQHEQQTTQEKEMSSPQSSSHTIGVTIGDMRIELKDTQPNRKALSVIIRELKSCESGKPVFTFQEIADSLGYEARQNTNNFYREFQANGEDVLAFLSRKNTLKEQVFPLIEAQVLESPWLAPHDHYVAFCQHYPDTSISEATFREYVNEIESVKILNRRKYLISGTQDGLNTEVYIRELLACATFSPGKQKEIVTVFPEVVQGEDSPASRKPLDVANPTIQKKLLVVLFYVCNVSQEMLAPLFGVGKTTIHNWIYDVSSDELKWLILTSITCWSGQVSFDEKWIWVDECWQFALCAVDTVTGFPLLIEVYPSLDEVSWTLFFQHFKALYGRPRLILSDGSVSLAAARKQVFTHVRFQLCKFHKLKNLMKYIRMHVQHHASRIRGYRLATHIFSNTSVSSRKAAAKTLQTFVGNKMTAYIDSHILGCWRHLTMSLTNNASERFNRKIEKCVSGRYGISSTKSVEVLLHGLWFRELLVHGRKHVDATSAMTTIDLSTLCQEHLDTSKILHFFHDNAPSRLEKLG